MISCQFHIIFIRYEDSVTLSNQFISIFESLIVLRFQMNSGPLVSSQFCDWACDKTPSNIFPGLDTATSSEDPLKVCHKSQRRSKPPNFSLSNSYFFCTFSLFGEEMMKKFGTLKLKQKHSHPFSNF